MKNYENVIMKWQRTRLSRDSIIRSFFFKEKRREINFPRRCESENNFLSFESGKVMAVGFWKVSYLANDG